MLLLLSNMIMAKELTKRFMEVSEEGKKLIERFEGRQDKIYVCPGGKITGGIGHALSSSEKRVYGSGLKIQGQQIDQWFNDDIEKSERVVNNWIAVPLTQGQFDALVSFVFNLGAVNFKRSTLLKELNKGRYLEAAEEILRWCHSRSNGRMRILPGLVARRQAERDLFLREQTAPVAAV